MLLNQSGRYYQSVDHAIDILEQFSGRIDELSLTDLTRILDVNKNSVFRILATLTARNYIHKNGANGCYRLGPGSVALGQTFKNQMVLLRKAKPVIEGLVAACNESSFVAIQKDLQIVSLDASEASHAVRVIPRLGVRFPLYCSAAGKVHLAYMSERQQDRYISTHELKRFTPHTITDGELLRRHLSRVAETGYAVNDEEFDSGVRCVSAPVRDYRRRIIAAVSISGPSTRFSMTRIELELIPLVRQAALALSISHGYPGEPPGASLHDLPFAAVPEPGISDCCR
jgi:DNA-binding IclR family transcriptional regulator